MYLEADYDRMRRLSADIRKLTIESLCDAGFGHIGGCMSIGDILGVLYGGVMNIRPEQPGWENRDRLVLSKGHCGPALYAALALKGYFPMEWMHTVNKPGTRLPSHCDMKKTPGIDMTTGSLGQGISAAAGIAFGNKLKKKESYTYCIVGDGEMEEGQVWEAVMFAVHQKLEKLIILIDYNKKQLDGKVADICSPLNIEEKFRSFGCHVLTVTGYDVTDICGGIEKARQTKDKPSVIILDTYKGIGCSFAEKEEFNHYMVITKAMADEAVDEIEKRYQAGTYPGGGFDWLN